MSLRAQPGQIHGHIRSASRLLAAMGGAHHWHRRLRRDASHFAPDVLVEHHVAHHQQALAGPFVLDLPDHLMQLFDHRCTSQS